MMEQLPLIAFHILAGLLVISALAVVTLRNVFYSAVFLAAALTLMAGVYILLGADFVAAAQVLVYVGGIMIIMLFVIMLSQQPREHLKRQTNEQWLAGLICSAVIAAALARAFKTFQVAQAQPGEMMPTSASLGRLLLGEMLLPFEAVSLVLLAALVGAVFFGQDKAS